MFRRDFLMIFVKTQLFSPKREEAKVCKLTLQFFQIIYFLGFITSGGEKLGLHLTDETEK